MLKSYTTTRHSVTIKLPVFPARAARAPAKAFVHAAAAAASSSSISISHNYGSWAEIFKLKI